MPTQEQLEQAYPFWRYHLWETGYGSYEQIESAVANGSLLLWICPKPECPCKWTKLAHEVSNGK